jgi:hypothetical protein
MIDEDNTEIEPELEKVQEVTVSVN